jgi:hypothetical protein
MAGLGAVMTRLSHAALWPGKPRPRFHRDPATCHLTLSAAHPARWENSSNKEFPFNRHVGFLARSAKAGKLPGAAFHYMEAG